MDDVDLGKIPSPAIGLVTTRGAKVLPVKGLKRKKKKKKKD